jgi:chromosome condensin MukBEF ATPase and DNA-binding subunit MukB
MAERRHQMRQATLERKEAAKQERVELISEVMAHPAIAAHVENMARMITAAERQAAAFEKIADALSRIAPTPERLQEEADEAPLRREEQEARTQTWKSASQLMPSMVEQILSRMKDALDIPGGNDEGSVQ